jgi:hypothetical protein
MLKIVLIKALLGYDVKLEDICLENSVSPAKPSHVYP